MTVTVARDFTGGWGVYVNGTLAHLCGDSKERAQAVARDARAGSAVPAFRRPTAKWL